MCGGYENVYDSVVGGPAKRVGWSAGEDYGRPDGKGVGDGDVSYSVVVYSFWLAYGERV